MPPYLYSLLPLLHTLNVLSDLFQKLFQDHRCDLEGGGEREREREREREQKLVHIHVHYLPRDSQTCVN